MRRLKIDMPFPIPAQERYVPYDMMLNDIGFWYPILKRSGVNTPRTIIINSYDEKFFPVREISEAMFKIGFPCFFRGGNIASSLKHQWDKTCFIKEPIFGNDIAVRCQKILKHCIDGNDGAEPLLYDYWAVREYIDCKTVGIYRDMPLKKEVRVFIKNNKVDCIHNYWNEQIPKGVVVFTEKELELINSEASKVAKYFYGYWSCDFMLGINGIWYAIDMALGEDSFHQKGCNKLKQESLIV